MTATRSRKQVKNYARHLKIRKAKHQECDFCTINSKSPQFIEDTKCFKVVRNIFPYSVWDDQTVADHLLILPKQHTDTLADIPPKAAQEFIALLSKYESNGYNILARAPQSSMKSLAHQHTHLIKLNEKMIKALLFIRKPYLRLVLK